MIFTVNSRSYPAGSTIVGPFSIPAGFVTVSLSLTRENWPDTGGVEIIRIEGICSHDGGNTWTDLDGTPRVLGINPEFSFGAAGGVLPNDKFGQPVTTNKAGPWRIVTPCQIKCAVFLLQSLNTAVTVEVL